MLKSFSDFLQIILNRFHVSRKIQLFHFFSGHLRLTLLALYINVLMIIKKNPNDLFKLSSCVVLPPVRFSVLFITERVNCAVNRRPICLIKNIPILIFSFNLKTK